jgi:integrase
MSYLSPADAHRYLDAVSPPFRATFALAIFAGLRPCEVCRAKWKDIHFGS